MNFKIDNFQILKSFRGPGCNSPQRAVDFRRRRTKNQVAQCSPGNGDVLVGAQDVNLVIRQHNPGLGHILNGVLGPAPLACNPANGSGQMVPFQGLHILHLETVNEEVVKPDQSKSIFNFKAKDKSPDKVSSLLQSCPIFCVFASPNFNISALQVESNLKLEVFNNGFKDLHPVLLERGVTMAWYWNLSHLRTISQLLLLDRWKSRSEWSGDTRHH